MNLNYINQIIRSICETVKAHGSSGQFFDKDFPIEYRDIIAAQLKDNGICAVRVSPLLDVYVPINMPDCEKSTIVSVYCAYAPAVYQAILTEHEKETQARLGAELITAYVIAKFLQNFRDDDDIM